MPIVKVRSNRQVTIPKSIFEDLGLQEGDSFEITYTQKHIILKPTKTIEPEDTLTPEEEISVEKGFNQLKQGDYIDWEKLKNELDL